MDLEQVIEVQLAQAKPKVFASDEAIEELIAKTISRYCRDALGKRPLCAITIARVE